MTPKQIAFLRRVEATEAIPFRDLSRFPGLGELFEPYHLTPDEALREGVASAEEAEWANANDVVFMEVTRGGKMRMQLTDAGRAALANN